MASGVVASGVEVQLQAVVLHVAVRYDMTVASAKAFDTIRNSSAPKSTSAMVFIRSAVFY